MLNEDCKNTDELGSKSGVPEKKPIIYTLPRKSEVISSIAVSYTHLTLDDDLTRVYIGGG